MNAAAGASFQAVVSSGVSLLTLRICDSLCFVLEVAPVALVEAPLLLFSFNLRTAGGKTRHSLKSGDAGGGSVAAQWFAM